MKKTNRKAFTIVELVIVIAVISILAAVLIPTFSGIIKSANIAADEAEAASLTTQLNLDLDGIQSADEIYEAIKKVYGDTVAENFAPRSAQYGYHYWYDIANNAVVLKTYDQIAPAPGEGGEGASIAQPSGVIAISTALVDEPTPAASSFEGKEHRTFVGYYLIDMGGVIGDALKALDTNTGVQDALSKLNEIASNEHDDNKSIAYAIVNLLGAISKVTDFKITASGTGVEQPAAGAYYASYHITDLKLAAGDFVSDTGANAPEGVKWYSDNDYATIDINTGAITLIPAAIIAAGASELTFTAIADAGVEDGDGNKLSKTVTVYIEYPDDLNFTLDGTGYDVTSDDSEIDLEFTGTYTFAFEVEDPSLKIGAPDVGCYADVVIKTDADNLFSIEKVSGQYVLTVNDLDSYENVSQEFTVTVGSAITKTFTVTVTDLSAEPYKLNDPFANPAFLYRVGNGNAIPLRVFFNNDTPGDETLYIYDIAKSTNNYDAPIGATEGFTATVTTYAHKGENGNWWIGDSDTKIKVEGTDTTTLVQIGESGNWYIGDVDTNVAPTQGEWPITSSNWANTQIKFTGTGVAKIKIGDVDFTFEVVEGNNVIPNADGTDKAISSPASGTNLVLLCDAYLASGKFNLTNSILFGNDFTFDVSKCEYTAGGGNNYVIKLTGGTINNVKVIGKNFDSFSATASNVYSVCNILSAGNDVIANSYISGCAAPVRLNGGDLTIVGTTLSGGSVANLDIRSGSVVLDDVTTINQKSVNDELASEGAVGAGIMVWGDIGTSTCSITVKNNLNQYNYVTKNEVKGMSFGESISGSTIANTIFSNDYADFTFEANGEEWINFGILSLTALKDNNNNEIVTIIVSQFNGENDGTYLSKVASFSGLSGYIYSVRDVKADLKNPDEYASKGQYYVNPSYVIDNIKNNVPKTEGSNVYCIVDDKDIIVSFDMGSSQQFELDGLVVATKYGKVLTLTNVYFNGEAKELDEKINLDAAGNYEIKFVFDDIYNYSTNGTVKTVQHEVILNITVYEVKPDAKDAEFTFAGGKETIKKTINGVTYVMPNAEGAVDDSSFGSITVNNETIYYPIVEGDNSNNSLVGTLTRWYYVFAGVSIIEYDSDNKVTASFNSSSKSMSDRLVFDSFTTKEGAFNGNKTDADCYVVGSNSNKPAYSTTFNSSKTAASDIAASYVVLKFIHTDHKGTTHVYYVGYKFDAVKKASGCFTSDTLVTLADGSQKEIQYVTYEDQLLAWDFNTGKYVATVPSLIDRYELSQQNVINLNFSDGTVVKMVVDHGFFDVEANNFVFLNEENVASYVGHTFVKASDDGAYENVELVGYEITVEDVAYYSIQTAFYNNCIVEGMFTLTAPPEMIKYSDWFNYFEIGEGMKYDEKKMQADIEQYGLYTYEDFADYVTYEQFLAFNGPYLKVLVGRGVVTYDQIIELIGMYVNTGN